MPTTANEGLSGLAVLGPLRLHVADRTVAISGALKNRLISRLALTPHRAVSTDALIDAMWGDNPPRTARQSLHVHISHLREHLRSEDADSIIATTIDGHYQLGLGREAVDAWAFEIQVSGGLAALQAFDPRRARDLLTDAIELWGDPFVDLADHAAAIAERHRLTALHESATDSLAEALIVLRELDDAVPLLRSMLAPGPLRERPYGLLMRAYLELGEPAQVVEIYDMAERTFQTALGIGPSDELRALAESVRRPLDRQGPAATASEGNPDVDIETNSLITVPADSDLRPLINAISTAADAQWRMVAHGRLTPGGNASPMSPVLELSGLARARRLGDGDDRRAFFARVTHALVTKYSAGGVVVIEGVEHASELLIDYLRFALTRQGPPPFTAILVDTGTYPESPCLPALAELCPIRSALDLPVVVPLRERLTVLDADELLVIGLVAAALRPVPTEVVVHASELPTARVADAVERLVARNLVLLDAGGGLDLRTPFDVSEVGEPLGRRAADLHLALAESFDRSGDHGARRDVAEARHRLAALPDGSPALAWQAAAVAVRYLESLGAYREVLTLLGNSVGPDDGWPDDPNALEVRLLLGRAHIRCGENTEGRKVLEGVITSARAVGQPVLFADAVRYLAEERAPQRSQEDVRDLVVEALEMLDPEPTDTRIQLMTDLANTKFLSDLAAAERMGRETVDAARGAHPATQARALTGYIQTLMRPGMAETRRQLAIEAQQHARRSGSTESLVLALTYEAMALIELGDPRRAAAPLRYAETLAAEVQVPRFQWWAATWRALLDFMLDDNSHVEHEFRVAFEIWPVSGRADPFECFASQITMLRLLEDRGAELLPILEGMVGPDSDPAYLASAALAFAQAGRVDEAIELIDRLLIDGAFKRRRDITLPFGLALTIEAVHRLRYDSAGLQLLRLVEPIADTHVVLNVWGGGGFYWGSLEHAHGLALNLAGDIDKAREALGRAICAHEQAAVPLFLARSRAALAAMA